MLKDAGGFPKRVYGSQAAGILVSTHLETLKKTTSLVVSFILPEFGQIPTQSHHPNT